MKIMVQTKKKITVIKKIALKPQFRQHYLQMVTLQIQKTIKNMYI